MKKYKKMIGIAVSVVFWLLIWYVASEIIDLELVLPSPIKVTGRFFGLLSEKDFWMALSFTIFRIVMGFLSGMILGTLFAGISFVFPIADYILSPVIAVIKATPVASFIVMVFLFFEKTNIPIFISFLMVLPIFYENTMLGLNGVHSGMLEFAKVYRLSKKDKWKYLYHPTLKKYVRSASKTSFGLAWKAGVAAEVIANCANSVGNKIVEAKTYLLTVDLYAWTLAVIIISVVISHVLKTVFERNKKCLK